MAYFIPCPKLGLLGPLCERENIQPENRMMSERVTQSERGRNRVIERQSKRETLREIG